MKRLKYLFVLVLLVIPAVEISKWIRRKFA